MYVYIYQFSAQLSIPIDCSNIFYIPESKFMPLSKSLTQHK